MAEFKFRCPYCLQKLKAEEEWRGEPMECPNCHRRYNIPEKIAAPDASATAHDDGGISGSRRFSSDDLARYRRNIAATGKFLFASVAAIFSALFRCLRRIAAAVKNLFCSNATAFMGFVRQNREELAVVGKFLFRCTLTIFIIYIMISMISRNLSCRSGDGAAAANTPAPAAPAAPAAAPAPAKHRPPPVEDREPRRILVHVTVRKKFSFPDEYYKFNCEYKLYADDVCIATKNSKSTMTSFNVRVPKGAALRAEMLGKNGFGGVADSISGPNFGESQPVASYEGQYITIDCW